MRYEEGTILKSLRGGSRYLIADFESESPKYGETTSKYVTIKWTDHGSSCNIERITAWQFDSWIDGDNGGEVVGRDSLIEVPPYVERMRERIQD